MKKWLNKKKNNTFNRKLGVHRVFFLFQENYIGKTGEDIAGSLFHIYCINAHFYYLV